MSDDNYYKVGGSLEYQHPTYVVRQADYDLYEGLKNGDFCYVLNSRQMGKSSLRVQMMKKLKEQGVKCASIDMTRIGSHVTPQEWYAGVVSELLRGFGLSRKVDFSTWWRQRELLPPLQRLSELIEDVLLAEFSQKLVIFIDEIDSIIKIKFKEDFFAFIRACYNQRVDNPEYNCLTFCLLGVATPSDLIEDKNVSAPFNIGRAIELTGFQLHEAMPLAQGLVGKTSNPQAILREVLAWTGGQPFLTQKVCKLVLSTEESIPAGGEAAWVENLVRARIIENWETQDEPEHLRTIRDRILWSDRKGQLLQLYQQILQPPFAPPYQGGDGGVKANEKPEHRELRLSGLVVKQQGKLRVYNRIYASVFNQSWVENALAEAGLLPEAVEKLPPSQAEIQALEQAAVNALQQFESQQIEALISAMQAGQSLKAIVIDGRPLQDYPAVSPLYALQTILDNIHERNWFMGHQRGVTSASFRPSGQLLATAGWDGAIRLWDLSDKHLAQLKGHQGSVWSVSFSPDGQLIVSVGRDGTARLWNLAGQQLAQFDGHQGSVWSLSFSPDGQYLVTTGSDKTARLWNLAGQQLARLGGHQGWVTRVTFSPDGQRLATVGRDGTARLWDLSGQLISQVSPHQGWVWSVSFSSDGQLLATVGLDAKPPILDLSGRLIIQLKDYQDAIASTSFSLDGQYLVTASSEDGTARLWNLFGQQLAQLDGDQGWVISVSFCPNGQLVATAGEDGTVCLWDLSGRQISRFDSNQGVIYGMSFTPNGKCLATAGKDGTVKLWRVEGLDELLCRGCDWLKDYFVTHPEALEKLEVCQNRFKSIEADRDIDRAEDVEGGAIASPSSAPVVRDRLTCEFGIDYTRLRDLLVAGQWQEADQETTAIMLRISGREAEGWLTEEDIENFPCADLLTIDQLWVKYSQGRFGFSIQKKIWQSVGGIKNAEYEIYCTFCKRVGWGDCLGWREFAWLDSSNLTFDTTAPFGHLPGGLLDWLGSSYRQSRLNLWSTYQPSQLNSRDESADRAAFRGWWNIISSIASRLEESNMESPAPTTVARRRLVTTASNESGEGFLGEFLVHDKLVRIYQGDITNLVTDVIVSSDDTYLNMSGGVSWRIRHVGGNEIYSKTRNLIPWPLGNVAVTTAGMLQAKRIFHGVVIDWRNDILPSKILIRQVVHICLKIANKNRFESIAFPLLGTGTGRFPVKVAWDSTLRQIIIDLSNENQKVIEVIIVVYGRRIVEELKVKSYLERIEKYGWKSLL